jgi:hypothetical protein
MLQHAQRNMHVMFDDQQALNHQLLRVSDALAFWLGAPHYCGCH